MEENRENRQQELPEDTQPEVQEDAYTPRPAWQVWAARVGLVLFILFVIYQLLTVAGGGA